MPRVGTHSKSKIRVRHGRNMIASLDSAGNQSAYGSV